MQAITIVLKIRRGIYPYSKRKQINIVVYNDIGKIIMNVNGQLFLTIVTVS